MFAKADEFMRKQWPYLLIFSVIFLFYKDIFLLKGAWLVGDHAEQHFPWANYLAQNLKQGILPFWTDMIQSGFPITAEGQIGTFYLPNILFYGLLPIRAGYAWNIVFHILLSAIFMLSFMKSLGIKNRGAVFGTLVYLFGSTLGGAYYNITSLKVLTWFPLSLIIVDQILAKAKIHWMKALTLGILFSFEILAGYLQFAVYAILFTGFYFLVRWLEPHRRNLRVLLFAVVNLGIAALIAGLLCFPQLALTYELAIRSNRGAPKEGFAYVGSYNPFAIACLLFPSLEVFFTSKLYLGVLPLYFMTVAVLFCRRLPHRTFCALAILAFLLALGAFSPLYILIVKVLHFYSFRTPIKFVYFAGFFLCVLAAMGMQSVLEDTDVKKSAKGATLYGGFLLAVFLGTLAAFFCFHFYEKELTRLGSWIVSKFIYGTPGHPFPWSHYQDRLENYLRCAQTSLDPRGLTIYLPVLKMLAAFLLIAVSISGKISKKVFYILAVLLLMADLNLSYSDIRGDYADYQTFFKRNRITEYLKQNLGHNRYFNFTNDPSQSPLPSAKTMLYGIESVNAYSPLVLKNYYDYFASMGGINDSIGCAPVDESFLIKHLKLLGLLNVKYIVSDRLLDTSDAKKVFADGTWSVYENRWRMDQLNWVKDYEIYENRETLLKRLWAEDFNPKQLVLLRERPIFFGHEEKIVQQDKISILTELAGHLELDVQNTEEKILLIAQTDFPGWQVVVDGEPAKIYAADLILMAIPLKSGRHRVTLSYSPKNAVLSVFEKNKIRI